MHDFTEFTTQTIKDIMKDCGYGKKKFGGEGFQDMDPGEIQEQTDTVPG